MNLFDTAPLTVPMPISAARPLRLFVVEDSDVVRALWRSVVSEIPGLSFAGEFNCATSAIDGVRRDPPDIVLLDIHLSETDGMEILRVLAEEYPMTTVIVVSNCAEHAHRRYLTGYPTAKVISVSNCGDLAHRQYFTKAGAYAFNDKGHGPAAVRCMRCMLEKLTDLIEALSIPLQMPAPWRFTMSPIHR